MRFWITLLGRSVEPFDCFLSARGSLGQEQVLGKDLLDFAVTLLGCFAQPYQAFLDLRRVRFEQKLSEAKLGGSITSPGLLPEDIAVFGGAGMSLFQRCKTRREKPLSRLFVPRELPALSRDAVSECSLALPYSSMRL